MAPHRPRRPANDTLPVGLQIFISQVDTDYVPLLAMLLLTTLPMLVVSVAFQRYFVQGIARAGLT